MGIAEGVNYPEFNYLAQIEIDTCTITAGSKDKSDTVFISGSINAKLHNVLAADEILVYIGYKHYSTTAYHCYGAFPVNDTTFRNKKFSASSVISNYKNSIFKYDLNTGKFTFAASKLDLNGLSCPFLVGVWMGPHQADIELDETVVNADKPCPVQLLKGKKNTLAVTKYKLVQGKKRGTDSFTAQGTFTLGDDYDKSNPLVITLGSQTYTVNGGKFAAKNSIERCKNAASSEGAIVDAKFDFAKCTYTISVENAKIPDRCTMDFGINYFGVSLEGLETVNIN
jgi:hypothetical protein